jgi:hypothetical protein
MRGGDERPHFRDEGRYIEPDAATAGRRHDASIIRCRGLAEFTAADGGRPERQGSARRLPDQPLHQLPARRALQIYKDRGVAVIGAHAPEFAFEENIDDVKKAVAGLKIGYLVALDNDYSLWRAFKNEYWPAHWLVDARSSIIQT